jgi:hypothetical protein
MYFSNCIITIDIITGITELGKTSVSLKTWAAYDVGTEGVAKTHLY